MSTRVTSNCVTEVIGVAAMSVHEDLASSDYFNQSNPEMDSEVFSTPLPPKAEVEALDSALAINDLRLDDPARIIPGQVAMDSTSEPHTNASSPQSSDYSSDREEIFTPPQNSNRSSPATSPRVSPRDSPRRDSKVFIHHGDIDDESDTLSEISNISETFEPPALSAITPPHEQCRAANPAEIQIAKPSEETPGPASSDQPKPYFVDSRPVSPASSIQMPNELSFEEKWSLIWEADTAWEWLSMGSQFTAAYASPVRNGHRVRTSCDSHLDPGKWLVEPDGFINEAGRAGGPFLCPLPFSDETDRKPHKPANNHPFREAYESWEFLRMVVSTMDKYNINPTAMKFMTYNWAAYRWFDGVPTLVFEASRKFVDSTWIEACREIWKWVHDHCDMKKDLTGFSVEIFDPEIRKYPCLAFNTAKDRDIPFADLLVDLKRAIDPKDTLRWDLFRMVPSPGEESAMTVFLKVNYRSDRDWRIVREQLVAVLDERDLSRIAVLITKSTESFDPFDYCYRSQLG